LLPNRLWQGRRCFSRKSPQYQTTHEKVQNYSSLKGVLKFSHAVKRVSASWEKIELRCYELDMPILNPRQIIICFIFLIFHNVLPIVIQGRECREITIERTLSASSIDGGVPLTAGNPVMARVETSDWEPCPQDFSNAYGHSGDCRSRAAIGAELRAVTQGKLCAWI
jgi:hypothetical protein